jgi:uncharacterized protein (TIGR00730 family)
MNITVFGSSKPKPGETDYLQAMRLGQLIAKAGHTVLTGGYIGTMEAVSHGAAEAGGHVIGVTCAQIERWRNTRANPWVKEERKFETLNERLNELVTACDAAIALPGGPGTLTEITLFWNLLIIDALPPRPLVVIGEGWQKVFQAYLESMGDYVMPADWRWILYADTIETGLQLATNRSAK